MNREQEQIITRYLDDTATPDEVRQLDEWVRTNPDVRLELIQLATQDALIATTLAEEANGREHLSATDSTPLAAANDDPRTQEDIARPDTHDRQHGAPPALSVWQAKWFWSTAAAALLVGVLGGWWCLEPDNKASAEPVGTVAEARGSISRNHKTAALKTGHVLRRDDTVSTGADGYLKYACPDGSLVEVRANSDLSIASPKALRLQRGSLSATVRKQPAGEHMTFTTPHAVATVLGTVLRLDVTTGQSELSVPTGKVEIATAHKREFVCSGESARVRNESIRKFQTLQPPDDKEDDYADGELLFEDSFEQGWTNWLFYTKKGGVDARLTAVASCPDIRILGIERDGEPTRVAALTGTSPEGQRIAIVTRKIASQVDAFSLCYEYTFDDRPRRPMEGIEIDMGWRGNDPPRLGETFKQEPLPPGKWNKVRWEYAHKVAPCGRPYADAKLFFNGELIGRRAEYDGDSTRSAGLVLEVIDGPFRFDNVTIRKMKKVGTRTE